MWSKLTSDNARIKSSQRLILRHKDPNCTNVRVNYKRGDVWCKGCEVCYRSEEKESKTYRDNYGKLRCNKCRFLVRSNSRD